MASIKKARNVELFRLVKEIKRETNMMCLRFPDLTCRIEPTEISKSKFHIWVWESELTNSSLETRDMNYRIQLLKVVSFGAKQGQYQRRVNQILKLFELHLNQIGKRGQCSNTKHFKIDITEFWDDHQTPIFLVQLKDAKERKMFSKQESEKRPTYSCYLAHFSNRMKQNIFVKMPPFLWQEQEHIPTQSTQSPNFSIPWALFMPISRTNAKRQSVHCPSKNALKNPNFSTRALYQNKNYTKRNG